MFRIETMWSTQGRQSCDVFDARGEGTGHQLMGLGDEIIKGLTEDICVQTIDEVSRPVIEWSKSLPMGRLDLPAACIIIRLTNMYSNTIRGRWDSVL